MIIRDSTFEIIAAKYYNNPNCIEKEEFLEDFNRFRYVKRLIKKYRNGGELKERLILNHLVILYNVFDSVGCNKLLFFKLQDNLDVLKPFLVLLNRLPSKIEINKNTIYTSDVPMDQFVVSKIRKSVLCHKQ